MSDERCRLSDALRWAVSGSMDPDLSAADWLAADIDAARPTAVALLTDPATPLKHLEQAKDAYKTLRIVGETSPQRGIGARLYAATIAAALVNHGRRISSQSNAALKRAFQRLLDDEQIPARLRDLGGKALCVLEQQQDGRARMPQAPTPRPAAGNGGRGGRRARTRNPGTSEAARGGGSG